MGNVKTLRSSLSDLLQERRMNLSDLQRVLKQRGRTLDRKRLRELQNLNTVAGKLNVEIIIEVCDALGVKVGDLLQVEKAGTETQLRRIASYRFPPTKQRRMDELLDKGNAGLLTARDRKELDELIEEFEERTLQKALAVDALHERTGRRFLWPINEANSNGH